MIRLNRLLWAFVSLFLPLVLFLGGCKEIPTQNLAKLFKNEKVPKQLLTVQSQLREIPQKDRDRIVERIEREKSMQDLLRIAVIDSGIDMAHPDLMDRLEYKVENGRIVGAGYDLLGNSPFASHIIVDPTLFAFGARSVRGGLIESPVESPLALLKEINDKFVERILSGIQADPLLKKSWFSRLNHGNFTFVGLYDHNQSRQKLLKQYQETLQRGEIIPANGNSSANASSEILPEVKTAIKSLSAPWTLDVSENLPRSFGTYMVFIEHADRFLELLGQTFETIESEYKLKGHLENLERFISKSDHVYDTKEAIFNLRRVMSFIKLGPEAYDPILSLRHYLNEDESLRGKSFQEALSTVSERLLQLTRELEVSPDSSPDMIKVVKKNRDELQKIPTIGTMLDQIVNDPQAYRTYRSRLRRHAYRSLHPYVHPETLSNSHGTHVAGIVARQHDNIRIVPVRATTQSVAVPSNLKDQLANETLADMKNWAKTPLARALLKMIISEYGATKFSERTVFSEVKKYLERNSLNLIFVRDLLESVRFVGGNKIKVANISLGTVFRKKHGLNDKLPSIAEDLFAEYVRYTIGNTIEKEARGTLFVIATGNDGGWVDGVSKTMFPVGITSLRALHLTKNDKRLPLPPNNALKNILAVASVSKNETLSSFTNILIDPNTSQIFSTGEEILAPVPRKTESYTKATVNKRLMPLQLLLTSLNQFNFRKESRKMEEGQVFEKANYFAEPVKLQELLTLILRLEHEVARERMSGTSMATPTVSGLLGKYIIEKMDRLGVKADELYTHKEFTPQRLINDVHSLARTNSLSRSISLKMLIDGIHTWSQPKGAQAVQKTLRDLFRKPKTATKANRCEQAFL